MDAKQITPGLYWAKFHGMPTLLQYIDHKPIGRWYLFDVAQRVVFGVDSHCVTEATPVDYVEIDQFFGDLNVMSDLRGNRQ